MYEFISSVISYLGGLVPSQMLAATAIVGLIALTRAINRYLDKHQYGDEVKPLTWALLVIMLFATGMSSVICVISGLIVTLLSFINPNEATIPSAGWWRGMPVYLLAWALVIILDRYLMDYLESRQAALIAQSAEEEQRRVRQLEEELSNPELGVLHQAAEAEVEQALRQPEQSTTQVRSSQSVAKPLTQ